MVLLSNVKFSHIVLRTYMYNNSAQLTAVSDSNVSVLLYNKYQRSIITIQSLLTVFG